MINPPNLQYHGDRTKAESLKGVALQFYSFCCVGIGESACLNRTKKLNDGSVIQAIITKDPYGNLNGVVRIHIAPVGGDENVFLFCTSFNDTDLGTQVYKKPYPPMTQGGLIDVADNPDYLVLPTPDFKVRNSYWVDDKEKNTISWQYVVLDNGYDLYKCGKMAIQGIETSSLDWGFFFEPVCCALISDTQLIVIYTDRVNYSGTGTTKYCAVYDYALDFINQKITLSYVSSFDLTAAGYGQGGGGSSDDAYSNRVLIGFLSDFKTVIYSQVGIAGVTTSRLKAFKLDDDYLSVLPDDTLIYTSPLVGSYTATGGVISEIPPHGWTRIVEENEIPTQLIEIRGKQVCFVKRVNSRDTYYEIKTEDYSNYRPIMTAIGSTAYSLCKWSYANGLTTAGFKTSSSSSIETQTYNSTTSEVIATYHDEYQGDISVFAIPISANDVIYSEYSGSLDYVETSGYYDAGLDVEIPAGRISETQSTAGSLKSRQAGTILSYINAAVNDVDYSYTKGAIVGAIYAAYDDGSGNIIKSFILDYKKKKKDIVDVTLTNISVTKLPTVTPT